jgi:RNA polymerase sigma-70 factor (sigma-E family)
VYLGVDDDEGFRDFVRARLAGLSRVAYLLTGDHHAAEDLVQAALVKVAARWARVSAADNPDSYVRKVMYHEHVSAWRRRRRHVLEQPIAQPPERPGPRDEAEDAIRRLLLQRALAKLTPRQRAVIVLRFFEDLSEADAAAALGVSTGTVKSQTHHALGRLRALAPELADLINDLPEVLV